MTYGYVRVSTLTQNISRQMDEMYKLGLTNKYIYIDKQSGKDFERTNYQKLKRKLKKDDLALIYSEYEKYLSETGIDSVKKFEMFIDEITEIGTHIVQIQLWDTDNGRVTIPPIQFEVLTPIF